MAEIETYRKKPVEVRMLLWTGENPKQMAEFTGGAFRLLRPDPNVAPTGPGGLVAEVFDMLHDTWIRVEVGHRVVEGTRGEFYPIAPEPLADSYEKVS